MALTTAIRTLPGYDPYDQAGDCWFEEAAARHAINFIQECIRIPKGTPTRPAGGPFLLTPFQVATVANLFGWKRRDGTRRYRECLLYVAKKNGKSAFVAAILLYVMCTQDEFGAELYSAASSKEQAGLLFSYAAGMVRLEPELRDRLRVYGAKGGSQSKAIAYEEMMAVYKCLAADADTADGANPSFLAIDEVHRHPDAELMEVLVKSTATRAQPLTMYTTTADYNRPSPCNSLLKRARAVRDNKGDKMKPGYDPAFLPVVYEADKKDDWEKPETWRKANPNMGITFTEEFMAHECQKAKENPSELNNFLRLNCNIVTHAAEAWLVMAQWNKCTGLRAGETPEAWRERILKEMDGGPCFLGLDLSTKVDLAAAVQIFRPRQPRGIWRIVPHFWVPAETAHEREKLDRVPYAAWERAGFVTLTDGNEIDSQAIRVRINNIDKVHPITEIGVDPWNATELCRQWREEDGFEGRMESVRQGAATLSDPMKEFEAMIVSGRIEHGDNPVLNWMVGNLTVKYDENGNIQPHKRKSTGRIDGLVATFTGMARALAAPFEEMNSVYENRGVELI